MNMRCINIAPRSVLSFGAITVLLVVLGLFSLSRLSAIYNTGEQVQSELLPKIQELHELRDKMLRLRIISFMLMASIGNTEDTLRVKKNFDIRLDDIKKSIEKAEKFINFSEERVLFERFKITLDPYYKGMHHTAFLAESAKKDEVSRFMLVDMKKVVDDTGAALQALSAFYAKAADSAIGLAKEQYEYSEYIIVGVILLSVLATFLLSWRLTYSITQPVSEALQVADQVASNNLNWPVIISGHDELTRLQNSLHRMQDNLRQALQHIVDSAGQLKAEMQVLNHVTEQSGQDLVQQHFELDQASTAVTEMTAAVEEVAQNASATSELASQSVLCTHQGQTKVESTLISLGRLVKGLDSTSEAISLLAENSRDIGRILEVIRNVAEQTNLLALNAAIEAARAGDAGRGFAVVADEVRSLAYRTQELTQEIEYLVQRIQQGTRVAVESMQGSSVQAKDALEVAQQAGIALEEICAAVSDIQGRNSVIACAVEEQAKVAREVDRNLLNIRNLSEQSAVNGKKVTLSSQKVEQLAGSLHHLTGKFRV